MRFRLRNDDGTAVDPVPFLVVSLLSIPILIGWGPPFLLEWGVPLAPAVAVSITLTAGVVVVAYYRYVLSAQPELRDEVPVALRVRRLLYAIFVGVVALLGLTGALVLAT
ncbi:hypothetical protein ACFOZ7_22445 [Natribaculum luteum]|uniref:Cox cluster protein n=1 Tax=Natribaculum luteum TaxID=1586232 RepID=A0ABD5P673_9EURY|nr:hypothetical protein [Natribaculum luteum]